MIDPTKTSNIVRRLRAELDEAREALSAVGGGEVDLIRQLAERTRGKRELRTRAERAEAERDEHKATAERLAAKMSLLRASAEKVDTPDERFFGEPFAMAADHLATQVLMGGDSDAILARIKAEAWDEGSKTALSESEAANPDALFNRPAVFDLNPHRADVGEGGT